jgi:HAD superfamily 5'-nucleotidase-like hydrolase
LANYNDNVLAAIYGYAKEYLLKRMGYPPELAQAQFDSSFAIRGLHFDTRTGFLLKLDAFNKVQTSCCFLGRQRVSVPDIVAAYGGISVATDYGARHLRSLVDLFAKAEATLLADCIEVFRSKHLDFEPDYVYRDVRAAVEQVHVGGQLHAAIVASPGHFLESSPQLAEFLLRLRAENKFVFLLTNSPFAFVDAGMRFMLAQGLSSTANQKLAKQFGVESAEQWTRLFDVCITSARKPGFFTRQGHFRRVDVANNGRLSWQPVHRFERGAVYTEGSLTEFIRLASISRAETAAAAAAAAPASSAAGAESSGGAAAAAAAAAAAEPISPMSASYNPAALKKDADDLADLAPLRGHQVLYWGDHVGADLTAPWQAQRWRTAAVVPEIARELAVQASPAFKNALKRMLRIEVRWQPRGGPCREGSRNRLFGFRSSCAVVSCDCCCHECRH